jgi:hypothetical protein
MANVGIILVIETKILKKLDFEIFKEIPII